MERSQAFICQITKPKLVSMGQDSKAHRLKGLSSFNPFRSRKNKHGKEASSNSTAALSISMNIEWQKAFLPYQADIK
jgi:hypothetical protein